jgi:hypothetical protein
MNIALRGMPPADQLHPFGYRQHRRSNRPIKHRPQFQQLVSQVHPLDWKNPVPASRINLVVIGAGTAGLVSAAGAAGLGAKVALIERHMMGGDCLNVGCVPSKAVISAARAAAAVRDAGEFGVQVPNGVKIDFRIDAGHDTWLRS